VLWGVSTGNPAAKHSLYWVCFGESQLAILQPNTAYIGCALGCLNWQSKHSLYWVCFGESQLAIQTQPILGVLWRVSTGNPNTAYIGCALGSLKWQSCSQTQPILGVLWGVSTGNPALNVLKKHPLFQLPSTDFYCLVQHTFLYKQKTKFCVQRRTV